MDGNAGPTRAEYASEMAGYLSDGENRAKALGNRGPLRFDDEGNVHPDIIASYWKHGFYVFENVIGLDEIEELRRDVGEMIERAPVAPDAEIDAKGRPALGRDYAREPYTLIKPLSDPWGGTGKLNGRHPTQMTQPTADGDAPEYVVFLMYAMCQAMPAGLRVYGHPGLLAIAEAVNGEDFVPYNDAIFVKQPGVGGSVSWHQDGVTHWDSPNWDEGIHGFNFQVQLYPTTPANCLWVVPASHKLGPSRHQGAGRSERRKRSPARRRPAVVRTGRRHHGQPPDAARFIRQHIGRHSYFPDIRFSPSGFCAWPERRALDGE